MASRYIPQTKQTKPSLWARIKEKLTPVSFYVWKIKVQFDYYPTVLRLGVTVYPQYNQLEFNVGKYALNFWYRG